VVLPAPLGPIRPAICPVSTSKETPSRATMPPKRTETSHTLNSPRAGLAPAGVVRNRVCATIRRTFRSSQLLFGAGWDACRVGLSDRHRPILEPLFPEV